MRHTLKIFRCFEHYIISLCGRNEGNVLFLIESLDGVTQQETWQVWQVGRCLDKITCASEHEHAS